MQQSRHNPLTFYLRTLLYMFIALLLRLIALLPLAALFVFEDGSALKYLALLCPVLIVFGILPLRYSFADALLQPSRQRYFSFDKALGAGRYWEKLMESLIHALSVLKWATPLLAMGIYAWYVKDMVDAKTLITTLGDIGRNASNIWYGFINFFVTLFGGAALKPVAASLMQGIYVVLGVVGLGVLVLMYGMLRNSGSRYIWVSATREDRPVRTEIRRRMRGRRWQQLLVGLCNLVLWSPFLAVVFACLKDVLGQLSTQLMMLVGYNKGSGLDVAGAIMPLIAAFLFLYLPLLPARRILTAAFACHNARHTAPKKDTKVFVSKDAQPPMEQDEPQAMPAALVPDWVRAENGMDAAPAYDEAPAYEADNGFASVEAAATDDGDASLNA